MDQLFLLKPGFQDPDFPGQTFFCWHCALIEGVLSSFPDLAKKIHVQRVEWLRPRSAVVEVAGPDNQSLPLLVLKSGANSPYQTGVFGGHGFIADKDAILKYLSETHGVPEPHP